MARLGMDDGRFRGALTLRSRLPCAVGAVVGTVVVCALVWASGAWAASSSSFTALATHELTTQRDHAVAAPLPGGDVLIAGGQGPAGIFASAELYDPTTQTFTLLKSQMETPRVGAVAAPLPDGDVLIAGGTASDIFLAPLGPSLASAELYDPATQTFTPTAGQLNTARAQAVAAPLPVSAALPDGGVLIAGGVDTKGDPLTSAEVYDAATQTFTALKGQMTTPRVGAVAAPLPDGDVLIAGGQTGYFGQPNLSSAEVYDTATQTFTALKGQMTAARYNASAAPLPNGDVLIAGGEDSSGNTLSSAEVYDPASGTFTPTAGQITTAQSEAAAAPLPGGDVLIAGGGGFTATIYDPTTQDFNALVTPRPGPVAAALPDGDVLIAGGDTATAETYDPTTQTFTALTAQMTQGRQNAVVAPLPSGDVLIAGGDSSGGRTAEVYDPATETFTAVKSQMTTGRTDATAAPLPVSAALPDGGALIVGGFDANLDALASAEVYDAATQTFTALKGQMTTARVGAVAAPLPGGDVLIAGGYPSPVPLGSPLASAEVYDPATQTFTALQSQMTTPRSGAVASPLANGDVLIAGGESHAAFGSAQLTASAEVYDPATQTFTALPDQMNTARVFAAAAPLPDGGVLIEGGTDANQDSLDNPEVFASAEATVSGAKFGSQSVGSASPAQTLTVTDVGALPLSITGASLGGTDPGDFAIAGDGCAGRQLAAGQTCTIQVTFTPTGAGARTATLTLADNEPVPSSDTISGTTAAATTSVTSTATPGTGTPEAAAPGTAKITRVRATGQTLHVTVACTGATGAACTAELQLVAVETFKRGRLVAVTARTSSAKHRRPKPERTRRTIVLAHAKIDLTAGHQQTLRLRLSSSGRRLLDRYHRLATSLQLTAIVHGKTSILANRKITLRPASHKPAHRRKHAGVHMRRRRGLDEDRAAMPLGDG